MVVPARNVTDLKAAWAELRLTITQPVAVREITDDQWRAFAGGRGDLDALRRELPVIVARFRDAAEREMMQWARRQKDVRDLHWRDGSIRPNEPGIGSAPEEFLRHYHQDIEAMNAVLFGTAIDRARVTGGLFTKPVAAPLHMDELPRAGVHYIGRIGALGFQMIRGCDILSLSDDMREVLMTARARDNAPATLEAMEQLRNAEILKSFALGAVVLMFGPGKRPDPNMPPFSPDAGTLHCSAPVPEEGAFSVLFRGASYLEALYPH